MRYRALGENLAKCPYYDSDSKCGIKCTGTDCFAHRLLFDHEIDKARYLYANCCVMPDESHCEWQKFLLAQEDRM